MADDKTRSGSPDRDRINLHEPYEVRHWTQRFNVSVEELTEAVRKVGSTVVAVEKHLQSR